MRPRVRVLLSVPLVLGLTVVACGDEDRDDTATPASSTSTAVSTTAPPSTPTTSSTSGPDTSSTTTVVDSIAGDFDIFLFPSEVGDDCSEVVGVPREATGEGDVTDALTQLLAGPTPAEEAQGLSSWFSADTDGLLRSVTVRDGRAEVDFDDFSAIIPNASSSCGSAALLAQLDRTILQFAGVDDGVYSFDGDRVAFYEWLQLSVPDDSSTRRVRSAAPSPPGHRSAGLPPAP